MKMLMNLFIFFLISMSCCNIVFADDSKQKMDQTLDNLWQGFQLIVKIYSDIKTSQEIEHEEIVKRWVQNNLSQFFPTDKIDSQELMKYIFPEKEKYNIHLIVDFRKNPALAAISFAPITPVAIKKYFNSKVELIDLYSEKISGGLFNMKTKRLDSLKSFAEKNSEKENFCAVTYLVPFVMKTDFHKRSDGRWQINIKSSLTGSCHFMEREKTFERQIMLVMPYTFQVDLSKIDDKRYIDLSQVISPVDTIIGVLIWNEFFEWLKREAGYKNIQI